MFCLKSSTFFPDGVVISRGLKTSCSVMGTLSGARRGTGCLTTFAFPLYVGVIRASTISPILLSAKRRSPSFDHAQDSSVPIVLRLPLPSVNSSCRHSFVSQPYFAAILPEQRYPLYQPPASSAQISFSPFCSSSVTS